MESAAHLETAITLFNEAWELMEKPIRSRAQDLEMLNKAHASLFHWLLIGKPVNEVRGLWQISRVYCLLGWHSPALTFAEHCLLICQENGIADFDIAFCYEAMARALWISGKPDESAAYIEKAREASMHIEKVEDREYFLSELASIST